MCASAALAPASSCSLSASPSDAPLDAAFQAAVDSYDSACRTHEETQDSESFHEQPQRALQNLLVASHRLALFHSQQRSLQQALHCLEQTFDRLHHADSTDRTTLQHPSHNSLDETSMALLKIDLSLLYAKALARKRDSQKASKLLRECRVLIQTHTPYNSVTQYQQHQNQQKRDAANDFAVVASAASESRLGKSSLSQSRPAQRPPSPSLPMDETTMDPDSCAAVEEDLATAPVASIEFVRLDVVPSESTKKSPTNMHHESTATLDTYTGDSSDSESIGDGQDTVIPSQSSVPDAVDCSRPSSPISPLPIKSCLRNGDAGGAIQLSPECHDAATVSGGTMVHMTESFASFACQSTLLALAGVAKSTASPNSRSSSTKRVSFSLLPAQQHDEERMAHIKAFVPRQKLKMLRDRRAKAAAASRRTMELPVPIAPRHEYAGESRLERIQELSNKLRQAELDVLRTRQARQDISKTNADADGDSVSVSVASTPSLTRTRAAKAMTVAVGYLANALLRPQPT